MSVSDCVTDRLFCRLPPENTRQKTHSRTDVRSFAGGNLLQPPPFRRATPLRCVQTSTSAEDTRHSLRSCLVSSASVAVCTQLHYVALLHSKRCLIVTASPSGFFVGWRIPKPTEKRNPLGPPRLTISSRDGPRGERSNLICRLAHRWPSRRFYENRKRWFGYGVSFVY